MITIRVLNQYHSVMFKAELNDAWVHIISMRGLAKPYTKSIKPVAAGTGNAGKDKEYEAVYDGYCLDWDTFRALGDESN